MACHHTHFHFCGDPFAEILNRLEKLSMDIAELNAKVDALVTNNGEMATEVGRIGALIQEIRDQLATNPTPEQLSALGARLDEVVGAQQAVEDSLRGTT